MSIPSPNIGTYAQAAGGGISQSTLRPQSHMPLPPPPVKFVEATDSAPPPNDPESPTVSAPMPTTPPIQTPVTTDNLPPPPQSSPAPIVPNTGPGAGFTPQTMPTSTAPDNMARVQPQYNPASHTQASYAQPQYTQAQPTQPHYTQGQHTQAGYMGPPPLIQPPRPSFVHQQPMAQRAPYDQTRGQFQPPLPPPPQPLQPGAPFAPYPPMPNVPTQPMMGNMPFMPVDPNQQSFYQQNMPPQQYQQQLPQQHQQQQQIPQQQQQHMQQQQQHMQMPPEATPPHPPPQAETLQQQEQRRAHEYQSKLHQEHISSMHNQTPPVGYNPFDTEPPFAPPPTHMPSAAKVHFNLPGVADMSGLPTDYVDPSIASMTSSQFPAPKKKDKNWRKGDPTSHPPTASVQKPILSQPSLGQKSNASPQPYQKTGKAIVGQEILDHISKSTHAGQNLMAQIKNLNGWSGEGSKIAIVAKPLFGAFPLDPVDIGTNKNTISGPMLDNLLHDEVIITSKLHRKLYPYHVPTLAINDPYLAGIVIPKLGKIDGQPQATNILQFCAFIGQLNYAFMDTIANAAREETNPSCKVNLDVGMKYPWIMMAPSTILGAIFIGNRPCTVFGENYVLLPGGEYKVTIGPKTIGDSKDKKKNTPPNRV